MNEADEVRLDQWLWYTRFYKTRGLATRAVKGGHVKVNGVRPKPGYRVATGDRIQIRRQQLDYEVTVIALPRRRGPATEARQAYVESDQSKQRRDEILERLRQDRREQPTTQGKPDKRTRRALRSRARKPN